VATTFRNAQTVQSINAALAESLYAKRAGADARNIPQLLQARLGVTAGGGAPAADKVGSIERQGYTIEKIAMRPEHGITIPALAFVPAGGSPRKAAVLYVNAAGRPPMLPKAGRSKPSCARETSCSPSTHAAGGRVVHHPARAAAIRPLPDRDARHPGGQIHGRHADRRCAPRVRLADGAARCGYEADCHRGQGNGGVLALYAAALEPRMAKVASERAPASYMDIVRAKMHEGIIGIVVPGVLRDFDLPDMWAR